MIGIGNFLQQLTNQELPAKNPNQRPDSPEELDFFERLATPAPQKPAQETVLSSANKPQLSPSQASSNAKQGWLSNMFSATSQSQSQKETPLEQRQKQPTSARKKSPSPSRASPMQTQQAFIEQSIPTSLQEANLVNSRQPTTMFSQPSTQNNMGGNLDTRLMEQIVKENRELKQALSSQSHQMQMLQERSATLQQMESETHQENEVLRYQMVQLKTEMSIEHGKSLEDLQIVEQLHTEKKEMQCKVAQYKKQLEVATALLNPASGKEAECKQTQTELENTDRTLEELKSLYQHFQIDFSQDDELRVVKAIYLQDRPAIRLYREVLFQKVAQRAIESAEMLYKRGSGNPKAGEARIFVENRSLKEQVQALNEVILNLREDKNKAERQLSESEIGQQSKMNQMQHRCSDLQQKCSDMKRQQQKLLLEVKRQTASKDILPEFKRQIQEIVEYQRDQCESLQSQHNELYQENRELTQNFKHLTKQKESEYKSHADALTDVKSELIETHQMVEHLQFENQRLLQQSETASLTQLSQIDQLKKELGEKEKTITNLIQRVNAGPGSGVDSQEDILSIPYPECLVMLKQLMKESREMKATVAELEKELSEKELEICELMQSEHDLLQKAAAPAESRSLGQYVKHDHSPLQLQESRARGHSDVYTIPEETSSVAQTEGLQGETSHLTEQQRQMINQASRTMSPTALHKRITEVKGKGNLQIVIPDMDSSNLQRQNSVKEESQAGHADSIDLLESLMFKAPPLSSNLEDIFDINSLIAPKPEQKIQIDPAAMILDKSPTELQKSPSNSQMSPKAQQLRDKIFNKFQTKTPPPPIQIESPQSKVLKDEFSELSEEQISKLKQLDHETSLEVKDHGDIDLVDVDQDSAGKENSDQMLFDEECEQDELLLRQSRVSKQEDAQSSDQSQAHHGRVESVDSSAQKFGEISNSIIHPNEQSLDQDRANTALGNSFQQKNNQEIQFILESLNDQQRPTSQQTQHQISNLEQTIRTSVDQTIEQSGTSTILEESLNQEQEPDQQPTKFIEYVEQEEQNNQQQLSNKSQTEARSHRHLRHESTELEDDSIVLVSQSSKQILSQVQVSMCDDERSKNFVQSSPDLISPETEQNSVLIADRPLIETPQPVMSSSQLPPDGEFSSLAELADKVVKPNLEETADFIDESEDYIQSESNTQSECDSSYFTRNEIVMKNATFGVRENTTKQDRAFIEKKLREQHGFDLPSESQSQNESQLSFAPEKTLRETPESTVYQNRVDNSLAQLDQSNYINESREQPQNSLYQLEQSNYQESRNEIVQMPTEQNSLMQFEESNNNDSVYYQDGRPQMLGNVGAGMSVTSSFQLNESQVLPYVESMDGESVDPNHQRINSMINSIDQNNQIFGRENSRYLNDSIQLDDMVPNNVAMMRQLDSRVEELPPVAEPQNDHDESLETIDQQKSPVKQQSHQIVFDLDQPSPCQEPDFIQPRQTDSQSSLEDVQQVEATTPRDQVLSINQFSEHEWGDEVDPKQITDGFEEQEINEFEKTANLKDYLLAKDDEIQEPNLEDSWNPEPQPTETKKEQAQNSQFDIDFEKSLQEIQSNHQSPELDFFAQVSATPPKEPVKEEKVVVDEGWGDDDGFEIDDM